MSLTIFVVLLWSIAYLFLLPANNKFEFVSVVYDVILYFQSKSDFMGINNTWFLVHRTVGTECTVSYMVLNRPTQGNLC